MAKREVTYNHTIFPISYEILYPNNTKTIIFLHGWLSKKELMKQAFGNSFKEYKHIYIDMPGFGASPNSQTLTTQDYKNIIELFLEAIKEPPETIFGHSFGGKVATLMQPKNLVLLSSAGILEKKAFGVQLKILTFKLLKPFGGKKIAKFFATSDAKDMSQNMYETLKNVVNEDFTEHFKAYKGNAQIFWGKADSATTLQSGEKISRLIKNANFFPLEGDHFFFLFHPKTIEQLITLEQ